MTKHTLAVAASITFGAVVLAGCSPAEPTPTTTDAATSAEPRATTEPTPVETERTSTLPALEQWSNAVDFLQNDIAWPIEIYCQHATTDGGAGLRVDSTPVEMYSFDADEDSWRPYLRVAADFPTFTSATKTCFVNVPAEVAYGPDINGFLAQYNMFTAQVPGAQGETQVEIAYTGSTDSSNGITQQLHPGTFATALALVPIADRALDGLSVIAPTTEQDAAEYVSYLQPVLDWYGYEPPA